jgi:hypothetical protein
MRTGNRFPIRLQLYPIPVVYIRRRAGEESSSWCDMSCDYLSKYHRPASRDALRDWSGWASTVIHGPRGEPDHGPSHASGSRAALRTAAGPCFACRATRRAALAGCAARRTNYRATAMLDLRTNGRTSPMFELSKLDTCCLNTVLTD